MRAMRFKARGAKKIKANALSSQTSGISDSMENQGEIGVDGHVVDARRLPRTWHAMTSKLGGAPMGEAQQLTKSKISLYTH